MVRKSIILMEGSLASSACLSCRSSTEMEKLDWWQLVTWNGYHGILVFWCMLEGNIWEDNFKKRGMILVNLNWEGRMRSTKQNCKFGNISTFAWRKQIMNVFQNIRIYRVFNLKVNHILIWAIYLLRFTTCYITQLTCIYSKCWKWCPFISMHLSTRFTMFLATFLSVLSFFNHFRNSTFYWRLPSKFFKEPLPTVGVRHRF